ncbi:MAG: alpha/beta hydrolase [Bacteroidota bacterium]
MKYWWYLFVFMLIFSCDKEEATSSVTPPTNLLETIIYKQIDGVDPNLLSLDIYYNNATEVRKPVVIYVHGGGWSIGDKANQLDNKISLFRSLDYLLVSINYRLSPFPYEINNSDRIKYPIHNEDVAEAIKWVANNIDQYGGDADKIALLGHSAGAHLVALTGTNETFLQQVGLNFSDIKGVAAIDTEGYDVLAKVVANDELYQNAFGTNMEQNRQASPIFNITTGTKYPHFFIAKRGSFRRISIANEFIQSLEQQGTKVFQVNGSIYDHQGINLAIGLEDETLITDELVAFLAICFQ